MSRFAPVLFAAALVGLFVVVPVVTVYAVPNTQQQMLQVVPILSGDKCSNTALSSLTPTLVASGSALHLDRSYDISASGAACWCTFETSGTSATATGRHFPDGAIIVGRLPALNAHCACDGAATFTMCANGRG